MRRLHWYEMAACAILLTGISCPVFANVEHGAPAQKTKNNTANTQIPENAETQEDETEWYSTMKYIPNAHNDYVLYNTSQEKPQDKPQPIVKMATKPEPAKAKTEQNAIAIIPTPKLRNAYINNAETTSPVITKKKHVDLDELVPTNQNANQKQTETIPNIEMVREDANQANLSPQPYPMSVLEAESSLPARTSPQQAGNPVYSPPQIENPGTHNIKPIPPAVSALENTSPPIREPQQLKPSPEKISARPIIQNDKAIPGNIDMYFNMLVGSNEKTLSMDIQTSTPTDRQSPDSITLDQAITAALNENFEVKASGAKTKAAVWDVRGAYSQYLPSVEYAYGTGVENSRPASYNDLLGNRVMDSTHSRNDWQFIVRQPIIDLAMLAEIGHSYKALSIAELEQQDTMLGIVYDTIDVYLRLVQARVSISLADDYKNYLDRLAQRMKMRIDGGVSPVADLDRVTSRYSTAEAARLEALGEYGISMAEFKRLTKLSPPRIEIPGKIVPDTPSSPQDALDLAFTHNASYLASQKKEDATRWDRNKALSAMMPKLSLEFTRTHSYDAGGSALGNPVDGVYPTQDDKRLMLVAKWSLSGGTQVAQTFSAISKTREMNMKSNDVKMRLEQTIYTGYDALNTARKRIAILQETLEADKRVASNFEEQYNAGGRSLFDLLDSYERVYNAKIALMRAIISQSKAAYLINKQSGGLSPELLKGN